MHEVGRDSKSRVVRQAFPSRTTPLFLACRLILLVAIVLNGCALSRASPPQLPGLDVSGVWEGTSIVTPCGFFHAESICNAVNRITLVLFRSGGGVTGSYRCDYGNYICRHGNMDRAGYIATGSINGSRMSIRVMIPADVSSCMFYGRFTPERANGGYTCYAGGGVVEVGIWEAARSY